MRIPSVSIAHSGRQHVHQAVDGLAKAKMLDRFYTPLLYRPEHWPWKALACLPQAITSPLVARLAQRSFSKVPAECIASYSSVNALQHLLMTFLKRNKALRKMAFRKEESIAELREVARFDAWVASQLQNAESDIFIGYEMSCLESFRVAKKRGMRCVLDHAATHWRWQDAVMQQAYKDAGIAQYRLPNSLVEMQKRKEQELELADVIFTPSQLAKDTFVENGVSEEKIKILPYGVDLDVFRPSALGGEKESREEDAFCLVFVGSVRLLKGLHYLIPALEGVKGCTLRIVGSISESVATLAASKGVAIELIPHVSHEELVYYLTASDLLVLPSIADSFGLVVLEAMACGVPVLVTEHVGAKDVVRDQIDGFVVPAMNVEALRAAIEHAVSHREVLGEMGQQAEKQAQQYSWQVYHQRLQALLCEL